MLPFVHAAALVEEGSFQAFSARRPNGRFSDTGARDAPGERQAILTKRQVLRCVGFIILFEMEFRCLKGRTL